jgi:hypothetical protein
MSKMILTAFAALATTGLGLATAASGSADAPKAAACCCGDNCKSRYIEVSTTPLDGLTVEGRFFIAGYIGLRLSASS